MLILPGIILTFLFGFFLSLVILAKMHPFERMAISFVLGLGLLTLLMFITSIFGLVINLANVVFLQLVLILGLLPFVVKKIGVFFSEFKPSFTIKDFSWFEKIVILVICLLVIYSLINNLYWPVSAWDALTLYDFRAKVIQETGSIAGFGKAVEFQKYYYGYPLMTSLAHTWIRLLGFSNPQFIYTMFYMAFIVAFYFSLRELASRNISFLFVLLLATNKYIFEYSVTAYTNLPFSFYYAMGTIYIFRFFLKKEFGLLFLSALMTGLSAWTRSSEPFFLANIAVLILWSIRNRSYLVPVWFSLIFLSIYLPWQVYISRSIPQVDLTNGGEIIGGILVSLGALSLTRLSRVFGFLLPNLFSWYNLGLYLFLFIAILFFDLKNLRKRIDYPLILIGFNLFLLFAGTYAYSILDPRRWEIIPDSMVRMSMFFIPLFLYYIGASRIAQRIFR